MTISIFYTHMYFLHTKKRSSEDNRLLWWTMTGSNCRHPACKAGALPAELIVHGGDPSGNRTRDTAVKGRCLNRLTNGPIKMAPRVGLEPTTDRLTADCSTD